MESKKLRAEENVCMMFNRFLSLCREEQKEHKTLILDMKQAFLGIAPVDAVEVVHARWELRPHTYRTFYPEYHCSACGGWKHKLAYEHENMLYCPNCGAKMDGEEKDSNLLFADMEEIIDA